MVVTTGCDPLDDHDVDQLVDPIPLGWSRVSYHDHHYGLTKIIHGDGRSLSLYAEQLGSTDVISANLYRTAAGAILRPCEMPAAKVLDFLRAARPADPDLSS